MATDTNEPGTATAGTDVDSVLGLLRWAWWRYLRAPELVGPFAFAVLLVVAAQAGITTTETPYGRVPAFAAWIWPVYAAAAVSVLLGFGVTFLAAADAVDGVRRPFRDRLRVAAKRFPQALLAGVIAAIMVGGGLLTVVVPGLYLLSKAALGFPACVVDELDAMPALQRGWLISGGSKLTILGLFFLYGAVALVVSVLVTTFLSDPSGVGFVGPFVHNAAVAAVAPLFGLALGRLYVARRG